MENDRSRANPRHTSSLVCGLLALLALRYFAACGGLEVFALTGQRVAVLHRGPQKAGVHRFRWTAATIRAARWPAGSTCTGW